MRDLPAFPKPGQIKSVPPAVRYGKDGREECNLLTKEGRDQYEQRKREMWERQGRRCCLYGHIQSCPGNLNWSETSFAHEIPRGHGGGSRDDRIWIKDKKTGKMLRQNGAAHWRCNALAGSRRILFNDPYNASLGG